MQIPLQRVSMSQERAGEVLPGWVCPRAPQQACACAAIGCAEHISVHTCAHSLCGTRQENSQKNPYAQVN